MISRVSLAQPVTLRPASPSTQRAESKGPSFADVLADTVKSSPSVRISAHAAQRLEKRGIQLSAETLSQVGEALDQLAGKGGKEALVLLGDVALVASVPNRTIITAVASGDDQASLFTNIDSAAVLPLSEAAQTPGKPQNGADAALKSGYRPDPLREAWAPRNDRRGVMT